MVNHDYVLVLFDEQNNQVNQQIQMLKTVMTPDQKAAMAEMRAEIARRNTEGLYFITLTTF